MSKSGLLFMRLNVLFLFTFHLFLVLASFWQTLHVLLAAQPGQPGQEALDCNFQVERMGQISNPLAFNV